MTRCSIGNRTRPEFDASVAELQRGRLPQQLAVMIETEEFTGRASGMPASDLLTQVFDGMLDRAPSAAETKTYLPQFQSKQYSAAVLKIVTSAGFRQQVAQDRALQGNTPRPQQSTTPERPAPKPGTPPAANPPALGGRSSPASRTGYGPAAVAAG